MGPLSELFSRADALKRRTKDLVQNPVAYAQQVADYVKGRLTDPEQASQMVQESMNAPAGGLAGITLLPANRLRGALGDIANQVQDYVSYVAKRGLPLSNEGLFFHEKVPFFVSPSSGKLMTINPEIRQLRKLKQSVPEKAKVGDIAPSELTELVPDVRNTDIEKAKQFEMLQMWANNIAGKYRPPVGADEARIALLDDKLDAQTLVHELMHDIQTRYGLQQAKPMSSYDISVPQGMKDYINDWGEKEARSAEGVILDMMDFGDNVSRLPRYARAPRINIEGTNIKGMVPGSEEEAVLQSLIRGSKETPFTFKKGGLIQMKEKRSCR